MEEIKTIEKAVPYVIENDNEYTVVFVEPGTIISTYIFDNLRDAKKCANEVKGLVQAAVKEGIIDKKLISKEVFNVEDIVRESTDEYGFKTVVTTHYTLGVGDQDSEEIFDENNRKITAEEKQSRIDAILEARRLEEEARLAALDSEGLPLDSEGK